VDPLLAAMYSCIGWGYVWLPNGADGRQGNTLGLATVQRVQKKDEASAR